MLEDLREDSPRWTLPPRKEISPENLHISSFVVVKGAGRDDSALFLRAGDKHPLSFRRGKFLLPAVILKYGEKPREGAKRALRDQLNSADGVEEPEFLTMQSYLGAHWDIVFVFQAWAREGVTGFVPKEPFTQAIFRELADLPRGEIAEDHLEVLDEVMNPSDATD